MRPDKTGYAKQNSRPFPAVGMRTLKSAAAAALCALIYHFLGRNPAFACIGAIFGTGNDWKESTHSGGNRFFGTLIGGFLGMGLFRVYLIFYPQGGQHLLQVLLVFIGTVLLILLCRKVWVGGIQPGGVVLCILLFSTPPESYISYSLNRILDTGIGVLAALFVNGLFPGGFETDWLYHEDELEYKKYHKYNEEDFSGGDQAKKD